MVTILELYGWYKQNEEEKTPFFGHFTRPFNTIPSTQHFRLSIYDGFRFVVTPSFWTMVDTLKPPDNNHEIHDVNINTSINASSGVCDCVWYVNISRIHHSIGSNSDFKWHI